MIAPMLVVLPPNAMSGGVRRGFAHGVAPGDERTLCGRVCELWLLDVSRKAAIGCKVCRRIAAKRGLTTCCS